MANSLHRRLLVCALLIAFTTATFVQAAPAITSPAPLKATAQPEAIIDHDEGDLRLQQLYNIIDALIGSGDFGNWANILSTTDPSMFPLSATLFVPGDSALTSSSDSLTSSSPDPPTIDPILFSYHIVPQRLSFSEMALFPIGSRLPTLLLDKSIVITNNSRSNFTLNRSHLTRPDLFSTPTVAVHGIREVLEDSTNTKSDSAAHDIDDVAPMPQPVLPIGQENSDSPPHGLDIPLEMPGTPPARGTASSWASRLDVSSGGFLSMLFWVLALIKIPGISAYPSSSP